MAWDSQQAGDDLIRQVIEEGAFRQALDLLVRHYQHAMVGFCTNMLGAADQGEEVAQNVFLAAYQAMPHFRYQASIRTWLFAIARKQCLKALRDSRRHRRIEHEQQEAIAASVHREASNPTDEDPEAHLQRVQQGLKALSEEERTLLLMRYEAGLLLTDIATMLHISETSVRRRLARALQRLREVMEHDA